MASYLIFGVCAVLWAALTIFFHWRRIWLLYYTIAAVGLALLLLYAGTRLIPLERWLELSTALSVHAICQLFGIPTQVYEAAPGNILVWIVAQSPGWTIVRVDLECSGLLELVTLTGLLLFYPAWSPARRIGLILLGWVATFGANIVRVLCIILILHVFGKPSIFIAHTIIGRLVFFILVAGIYWFFLTRGTLLFLKERLMQRMQN